MAKLALVSLVSGIASMITLLYAAAKLSWAIFGLILAPVAAFFGANPDDAVGALAVATLWLVLAGALFFISIASGAAAGVGFLGRRRRRPVDDPQEAWADELTAEGAQDEHDLDDTDDWYGDEQSGWAV